MEPFLKWAGGKRWFVKAHAARIPSSYSRYIEPFLGSGAVFFHLQPENALISDINERLIEAYRAVQSGPQHIINLLKAHHDRHNKDYYYEIRSQEYDDFYERAAQFIYLNKTCFNGLYRVNLKGMFNVPIGTKENVYLPTDDYHAMSKVLQRAMIEHSDFEAIIDRANEEDFLFVDPPYTVKHNKNGFIKYNERLFSWEDQVRLHGALSRAHERGVKIVCTNAHHDSLRELYKQQFKLKKVNRKNTMAGLKTARGRYNELLITNF